MLSKEKIEEYINILIEKPEYVDKLPNEIVNQLIEYLQSEISKQEQLINQLKNQNGN